MNRQEVLRLVETISPHAKEYVDKGYDDGNVELLYSNTDPSDVFLKVDNRDSCIFYAAFTSVVDTQAYTFIENFIKEYVKNNQKEICFNVYGENSSLIDLANKLEFKIDMIGYHMEFVGPFIDYRTDKTLSKIGYKEEMLEEFIELFDNAYYKLNIDNGWEVNWCKNHKDVFSNSLMQLDSSNQLYSFWNEKDLIGSYITDDNYITDIVVNPKFQGIGYGRLILSECIKDMMNNNINNIRLRVTKSNKRAINLYKLNNFKIISNFAEHTYNG